MLRSASYARQSVASPVKQWLGLSLIGLVMVGVVSYIFLTNAVATKGYEIKQLQSELSSLKSETEKLEAEAAVKQSSDALNKMVAPATYVAVERVEYLAPTSPQVGVAVK